MIIAIDGPAGAGKSTVARAVAQRLGLLYLNTGAMYRAVAWLALQRGIDPSDSDAVTRIAETSEISFQRYGQYTFINGKDVTEAIHAPEVEEASSAVATISGVRRALVEQQRRIGQEGGLVAEGRDMTTVVFPEAEVKIYLAASPEVRARRRWLELREKGIEVDFEEVLAEVERRDLQDSTREDSPLQIAADAVVLDTTDLSVEEVIDRILDLARASS